MAALHDLQDISIVERPLRFGNEDLACKVSRKARSKLRRAQAPGAAGVSGSSSQVGAPSGVSSVENKEPVDSEQQSENNGNNSETPFVYQDELTAPASSSVVEQPETTSRVPCSGANDKYAWTFDDNEAEQCKPASGPGVSSTGFGGPDIPVAVFPPWDSGCSASYGTLKVPGSYSDVAVSCN